eukprot:4063265-Amphidinium_carterae.2
MPPPFQILAASPTMFPQFHPPKLSKVCNPSSVGSRRHAGSISTHGHGNPSLALTIPPFSITGRSK